MAQIASVPAHLWRSLKIMSRNKVGFFGLIVVIAMLLLAVVGPHFVPAATSAHVDLIYNPPGRGHWLGTDYQGRDIFSEIVNGGWEIIYVAALTALLSTFVAVTLGSLAALVGGRVEWVITSVGDMVLTIPQFPLLIVLAGFLRLNSATSLALILASLGWAGLMRAIQAQVLSLKERDYVQAARCLGLPTSHLLFKEILPNMMSFVAISFVISMTSAIYSQVGLIFLGIVPLSTNNWGVMISLAWTQGAIFSADSAWYLLVPIAFVALLQFALVSMTRSLDELYNPRLRGE